MANPIQARFIFEILGRPPEHIVEGLKLVIEKLKGEKGVRLLHFNIHEPVPVKDSKDMFTTFSEIEVEADTIHEIFLIVFRYMPANLEIIYPEKITLNNNELNQAVNHLAQRLHNYDALAKNAVAERDFFAQKLKEFAPQLFKQPETAKVSEKKKKVPKKPMRKKKD